MKNFWVTVPIAGAVQVLVAAEDESSAFDAALDAMDLDWKTDSPNIEVLEWDCYRRLVQGNVLHAAFNEVSVEETEDEPTDWTRGEAR